MRLGLRRAAYGEPMRAQSTACSKDAQHAPVHGIACMLRFLRANKGCAYCEEPLVE